MKLKDLMMQTSETEQRKMELEHEVDELQKILEDQLKLQMVLQYALHKPLMAHRYFYPSLPHKVQLFLSEIAAVDKEISYLEKKVSELRFNLCQEKKKTEVLKSRRQYQQKYQERRNSYMLQTRSEPGDIDHSSTHSEGKHSWSPCSETRALFSERSLTIKDEDVLKDSNEKSRKLSTEYPNQLSEELVKCLINIFLALNEAPSHLDSESSATIPKLALSCMSSRSFTSKSSFNSKVPISLVDNEHPPTDPYGMMNNHDCLPGDIGSYKRFIQFTRNSLNFSQMPQCITSFEKLRSLIGKLHTVDLRFSTYKQKLAFWINTYNACIMHAFLHYGLPSTTNKLLAVMNKAALNVGGIILNALAIEHFILRHPSNYKSGTMDEKEAFLRHAYGLEYPEPNVTFALCRGCRSSPAIRVYTAENVVNELETAKSEYLQASIGVTIKKKIILPKLLHWYMHDFADDLESLLEWIYSQLPKTASLRRSIVECLKGQRKWPIHKMIDVLPYEPEFRYILAV